MVVKLTGNIPCRGQSVILDFHVTRDFFKHDFLAPRCSWAAWSSKLLIHSATIVSSELWLFVWNKLRMPGGRVSYLQYQINPIVLRKKLNVFFDFLLPFLVLHALSLPSFYQQDKQICKKNKLISPKRIKKIEESSKRGNCLVSLSQQSRAK